MTASPRYPHEQNIQIKLIKFTYNLIYCVLKRQTWLKPISECSWRAYRIQSMEAMFQTSKTGINAAAVNNGCLAGTFQHKIPAICIKFTVSSYYSTYFVSTLILLIYMLILPCISLCIFYDCLLFRLRQCDFKRSVDVGNIVRIFIIINCKIWLCDIIIWLNIIWICKELRIVSIRRFSSWWWKRRQRRRRKHAFVAIYPHNNELIKFYII